MAIRKANNFIVAKLSSSWLSFDKKGHKNGTVVAKMPSFSLLRCNNQIRHKTICAVSCTKSKLTTQN